MPEITISMNEANAVRVNEAIQGLWPKPAGYSDLEWAKRCVIRQMIARMVHRWEDKVAKDAVTVELDPNIAT